MRVCDHCGNSLEEAPRVFTVYLPDDKAPGGDKQIDLCPDCARAVAEFIEEGVVYRLSLKS